MIKSVLLCTGVNHTVHDFFKYMYSLTQRGKCTAGFNQSLKST